MDNEDVKIILGEFNKQINELRKDFTNALEKLSDKMVHQSEISISCSKDIEAVQMLNEEKIREMKKDIDGIAQMVRSQKGQILSDVEHRIKKGDLATRLAITLSLMSGMGAMILFLLSKI